MDNPRPVDLEESLDETVPRAPILILGAGQNVGLYLAKRLIQDNQPVILSFRSKPDDAVGLQLDFPKHVLGAFPLDARTPSAVTRFFEQVNGITDRLSGLVNCIGPWLKKPLMDTDDTAFEELVQGNLVQAFSVARNAFPLMKANMSGRLIHFTFAGVEKIGAYGEIGAYAAAKLGLLSLTRSLAVEWAPHRITVNAIAPGVVDTAAEEEHQRVAHIPSGHLASGEDIYQAAKYLLSDAAAQVTGTNLTVSGGFGWQYP